MRLLPSTEALGKQSAVGIADCYLYVRQGQVHDLAHGWYRLNEHGLTAQPWLDLPDPQGLDDNAMVWNSAALAVFFVSTGTVASVADYQNAGAASQNLMEQLLAAGVGSCAMGEVHPEQRDALAQIFGGHTMVHHFVAGAVSSEQQQSPGSSSIDRAVYIARHVERQLQARLPHYMLPDRFVFLEHFPLSANGKIDRAALLLQGDDTATVDKIRPVPETPVEIALASLWSKLLGIEQHHISVEDHFFRLGGNSLLAMQFISRVNRDFNYSLKLDELYQYSDLKTLSIRLEAANADSFSLISGEI